MKKKFAFIMSLTLILTTILTGCSMPFGNKEEKPDESQTDEVVTTYLSAVGALEFEVGSTVSATSLVSVSPEKAGEVTQTVIMNSDGSVSSEFVVEAEGEIIKTVIVEFIDGTSESIDVSFMAVKKDILSTFSQQMQDSIISQEWYNYQLPTYKNDKVVGVSYSGKLIMQTAEYLLPSEDGSFSISGSTDTTWAGVGLSKTDEELLAGEGKSPLRNSVAIQQMLDALKDFMISMNEQDSESEVSSEQIATYFDYMAQLYNEVITVSTEVTEYNVYDVDGKQYPVKAVYYNIDGTTHGYESSKYPAMYYVDYSDTDRLILVDQTMKIGDVTVNDGTEEAEELSPEAVKDMTYDDFKNYVVANKSIWDGMFGGYYLTDDTVEILVENFIIGDVTKIKPVKEEPIATPEPEPEQSVEVEVPVEDLGEVTEPVVERTTYAQMYPELFVWTNGENPDTYRRWYYTLTEDTEFVGTIRKPDGTVIEGDLEFEDGFQYDLSTGQESNSNDYKENGQKIQSYTLTSAYGNYEITDAGTSRVLEFKNSESTSGRMVFSYNNNKYYIQTIRSSEISDYMKECLYATSNFSNKKFTVTEGGTNDIITTEYGRIIPYTITYTNLKGNEVKEQYMAVYNLNNDYLVCYADNLTGTNDIFTVLLKELVVKK